MKNHNCGGTFLQIVFGIILFHLPLVPAAFGQISDTADSSSGGTSLSGGIGRSFDLSFHSPAISQSASASNPAGGIDNGNASPSTGGRGAMAQARQIHGVVRSAAASGSGERANALTNHGWDNKTIGAGTGGFGSDMRPLGGGGAAVMGEESGPIPPH